MTQSREHAHSQGASPGQVGSGPAGQQEQPSSSAPAHQQDVALRLPEVPDASAPDVPAEQQVMSPQPQQQPEQAIARPDQAVIGHQAVGEALPASRASVPVAGNAASLSQRGQDQQAIGVSGSGDHGSCSVGATQAISAGQCPVVQSQLRSSQAQAAGVSDFQQLVTNIGNSTPQQAAQQPANRSGGANTQQALGRQPSEVLSGAGYYSCVSGYNPVPATAAVIAPVMETTTGTIANIRACTAEMRK